MWCDLTQIVLKRFCFNILLVLGTFFVLVNNLKKLKTCCGVFNFSDIYCCLNDAAPLEIKGHFKTAIALNEPFKSALV